jgi:catechol 2,3-dioxygenase-like lactoylglutathione lyase family enzyme
MNGSKAYLEHVAIWVKDIHWHIRFFEDVLGMTMREVDGTVDAPRSTGRSAVCNSSTPPTTMPRKAGSAISA